MNLLALFFFLFKSDKAEENNVLTVPNKHKQVGKLFFPEVEVLLRKTLDKTVLLQRHFYSNSRKKTVIAEKTTFNTSIPE